MPIRVYWVNNLPDVICVEYTGAWTMTEFHQAFDEFRVLAASVPHKVNLLVDMRAMDHLPTGLLTAVRGIVARRPKNTGLIVAVGTHPLVVGFVQMLSQLPLMTAKIQLVQCYEDALSLIEAQQSGLSSRQSNRGGSYAKTESHRPELPRTN